MRNFLSCVRGSLVGGVLACLSVASQPLAAADSIDYLRDIKPLLAERCFACHGALRQRAGLRLDAVQLLREGGDSGPTIEAGNSTDSLLIDAVLGSGGAAKMPPEGEGARLNAEEIELLRRWIDQGARADDEPVPPDPRLHWAYQPVKRASPPQVKDAAWQSNAIDSFVAEQHETHGLVSTAAASPATLLRRVYVDLVGLPPTREELHAFVAAPSEEAYEGVVDRLLASSRYGERWGRHWMDIWRYSDWFGLPGKMRHSQKHIWRWRDWIVESLNEDKGYDRMVLEMLAGDELEPTNPDVVRGTGFLARSWYLYNRNTWLNDVVEHTGKAFLGITMNCVRCHAHKYDPISQEEYYRYRAIFEPHRVRLDVVGEEIDLTKDGLPRVYDADLDPKTFLFIRGQEEAPDKSRSHPPDVPAVLGSLEGRIRPANLPLEVYFPMLKPVVRQAMLKGADVAIETARAELIEKQSAVTAESVEAKGELAAAEKKLDLSIAQRVSLKARLAADVGKYYSTGPLSGEAPMLARRASEAERGVAVVQAELDRVLAENALVKAKSDDKASSQAGQERIAAATKRVANARDVLAEAQTALKEPEDSAEYSPVGDLYPTATTGRRLAFARWLTDRQNPLVSRVAVNHMWARHFGEPLVESVFDFGLRAKRPVHLDLLDWLATELMESGWSTKALHRLMVTSRAYRMRSGADADSPNIPKDPDNRLLWRMNSRRMEAESVRDTLIFLTDNLDSSMSGPDLPVAMGEDGTRRTIYYRYARDDQMKFLTMFDAPNVDDCYRRRESIVPQQALAMSNSKVVLSRSRQLAALISEEVGSESTSEVIATFIVSAFERVIGRSPTIAEQDACVKAVAKFENSKAMEALSESEAHQRARENIVHVIVNHNEFITVR